VVEEGAGAGWCGDRGEVGLMHLVDGFIMHCAPPKDDRGPQPYKRRPKP
jgi:hypothetical protein